jgi:hypothetical protein
MVQVVFEFALSGVHIEIPTLRSAILTPNILLVATAFSKNFESDKKALAVSNFQTEEREKSAFFSFALCCLSPRACAPHTRLELWRQYVEPTASSQVAGLILWRLGDRLVAGWHAISQMPTFVFPL